MTHDGFESQPDILIVDDTPANLRVLSALLEDEDWSVRVANNGIAALVAFETKLPDVVLLDVRMPDMDGFEVCRQLRAREPGHDVPIIFISAAEDIATKVEGFNSGGVDYITKPFHADEVIARVRTQAQIRRYRKELARHRHNLEELVAARTTELSQAYASLQEKEALFRQVTDNIQEVFWLLDVQEERALYISPAFESVWGIPRDPLFDNLDTWRQSVHPDDLARITPLTDIDDEVEHEYRIYDRTGEMHWIRERLFPIRQDTKVVRLAGFSEDITIAKLAGEKEEIHRRQLIQADKMASLGLMVSGVAHEINNPNNLIMMNTGVLETLWQALAPNLKELDATVSGMSMETAMSNFADLLEGCRGGSDRIMKIVQNMKEFARTDSGQVDTLVDIRHVIESALALSNSFIRKSTDDLEVRLPDSLPLITGNLQKLEQVIINLLSNACQALENKEKSIKLFARHDTAAAMLVVEVIDEGVGISEEHQKSILDPFFTTKRDSGGTGLGLSVSYGIIREHNGELEFDSQAGQGTTARIRLPVPAQGVNSDFDE